MKPDERLKREVPDDYSLYEYCVIRYVPHIEREEFINVGLLMMCKRRRWLCCRIHIDPRRLALLAPGVSVAVLRKQLALFERRDVPVAGLPVEETYRWLCAAKSAVLQTSSSHPGIAPDGNLEATFQRLFERLVL